ncbi:hypothetical protein M8C17_02900 [Micromonospora sp. RHAY321]|uniref:hypothetical protein n=1 Tax=Micromonospora sp. RHAY321 TaxID=2944807 RepID=UPI00207D62E4|nr:hypothetical protein [Micromonospora sp. RHAY321]MCO1594102.1 hypothetical protein [Micromonospora sp. RHAY321]
MRADATKEMPAVPGGTDNREPVASPPTTPAARRPGIGLLLAVLVACWLVPVAANAVHAAWLLPPLVLFGTASLLRSGRTLLDRMVLALALLAGLTCAAGLLFSVWPWGLHPVPVSGLALTVLTLAAVLSRRAPRLPRPGWSDLVSVAAAAVAAGYLATPYLRATSFGQRLNLAMVGEDNGRHPALFDVIGRLGGYLFVDPDTAREQIFSGLVHYPQGWHLTSALLDGFLRSSGPAPAGPALMDHYVLWCLATFGVLVLALVWAAQHVAGPLHPLRRLVLIIGVTALVLGTELPRLLVAGYPSETFGLSLAVFLVALVVRPLSRLREQLILVGALLIGIGFCYYLFLFPTGAMVLCWLIADRRRLRARLGTVAVIAVVTAALAPLTALLGLFVAGQSEALAAPGGTPPVETYNAMLGLGAVVLAAISVATNRGESTWRRYLVALAVAVLFSASMAAVNLVNGTQPAYYFGKTAHLVIAVLIVGAAALARLLPVPAESTDSEPSRRPISGALPSVATAALVTVALLAGTGVIGWTGGFFHRTGSNGTWAKDWADREVRDITRSASVTNIAYRNYPAIPGTVTLVVDKQGLQGYRESIFLSAMQGTSGQTEPGIYFRIYDEPARTAEILRRVPRPLRLIVAHPDAQKAIDGALKADPSLREGLTLVPLKPGAPR